MNRRQGWAAIVAATFGGIAGEIGLETGNGPALLAGLGLVAAAIWLLLGSGWPDPSPPTNPTRDRLDAFGRAAARSRKDHEQ